MRRNGVLLWLILVPIVLLGLGTDASAGSSFALFDGSNPANQPNSGAVCTAISTFTYLVAVANWGADGEVRITYNDLDIVRFPIKAGASFAFSQAAGSPGGHDRSVRGSNGGSAAQLAGSMSAAGPGSPIFISCDADSSGDAGCDAIVPN